MRHVPLVEFEAGVAGYVAAAQAGEEIVITEAGRHVRLVPEPEPEDHAEARRAIFERMAARRDEMRVRGSVVTQHEMLDWIREGRR